MGSAVRIEQLPPASAHPFAQAVRAGEAFLPPLPNGEAAWRAAADAARARTTPLHPELAEALAVRQAAFGDDGRAAEGARALARPGALAVVTGQQPGLLGGPLLSLHKAAGALALARALRAQLAVPVVPVFWLAAEDHDLDEANRLWVLDRDGSPRRFTLDLPPADGRSLMDLEVPDGATTALLAEVRAALPDTERARAALDRLARREGEDCATWCGRCLLEYLGPGELVLLEPSVLLPYAGDILATLLEEARGVRRAVDAAGARLAAAGWTPPLAPSDDEVPLFLRRELGAPRERVAVGADGRVRLRGEDSGETAAEVAGRIRAAPRLASGDAIGRVFVQNALLPVLAYVGGPTELTYHAQVRAAHEALGLDYPLAVPRPEATWVDAKAARAAEAFGLAIEDVVADPEALDRAAARLPAEGALDAPLARWVESVGTPPDDVEALLASEGQGSRELARAAERLGREAAKAAEKVRAADARDRGVGADRRQRLDDLVRPRGRPQERSLSPVTIAARHGFEALREGLDGLDPRTPGHYVIHLG